MHGLCVRDRTSKTKFSTCYEGNDHPTRCSIYFNVPRAVHEFSAGLRHSSHLGKIAINANIRGQPSYFAENTVQLGMALHGSQVSWGAKPSNTPKPALFHAGMIETNGWQGNYSSPEGMRLSRLCSSSGQVHKGLRAWFCKCITSPLPENTPCRRKPVRQSKVVGCGWIRTILCSFVSLPWFMVRNNVLGEWDCNGCPIMTHKIFSRFWNSSANVARQSFSAASTHVRV